MEQYEQTPVRVNEDALDVRSQAAYDHKRYPNKWLAMVGAAGMVLVTTLIVEILSLVSGGNINAWFRTEFGADMFSAILSQFFGVLMIPLILLTIAKKDLLATARLKKNINAVQVLLLVLGSVFLFMPSQMFNSLIVTGLEQVMGPASDVQMSDATNISQLLFELVIVAGLPAICEELFFRGMVMRAFERIGAVAAVVLSSVVFAIMHGNFQQFGYAFLLGLFLGTVTMLSDSLLAGSVIHFTMNAISVILSYPPIYTEYERIATEQAEFVSMFSFFLCPLAVAGIAVLFVFCTRKRNQQLYGKKTVGVIAYPEEMPKQKGGLKALYVIAWIAFVVINIGQALTLWYYDALMEMLENLQGMV